MILVTGGAGFIGSNFVLAWLAQSDEPVLNLDALTYAGDLRNLDALRGDPRHAFVHGDVRDRALLDRLLAQHQPRAIVHLAAETHVDRSIDDPSVFVRANVEGTCTLLEAARAHWSGLDPQRRAAFRFLHVSTDEVYGSLAPGDPPFAESHPHRPNSPYAASKAGADHLVRAWHRTWGLPVLVTNCSNNYGPRQYPEKLVPLMIARALAGATLPLYGDGGNVRDWLHVGDHCAALRAVLERGRVGETFNVGAADERTNLEVVRAVCDLLDELRPDARGPHRRLVGFVADRPGHDRRYAIDAGKIRRELGWAPRHAFDAGLRETVQWYLDHPERTAAAQRDAASPAGGDAQRDAVSPARGGAQ